MHAENHANRQKETSSVKSIENNITYRRLMQTGCKSLTIQCVPKKYPLQKLSYCYKGTFFWDTLYIQANQNNRNNANLMPKQRGKTNGNCVNNDSFHVNREVHVSRKSHTG